MPRTIDISEKISQLRAFYKQEGRAPSYAEMAELFGYKSKNAVYNPVNKLIALNYLSRSPNGRIGFTAKITGGISLLGSVQAGFPSPAEEELVDTLSLDEFLVTRPEATYLLTVSGDSMIEAGIFPGDVLVVDRSITDAHGDIVIVAVNGELTVKLLETKPTVRLVPMNRLYEPIIVPEDADLEIFGVATTVVHSLRRS